MSNLFNKLRKSLSAVNLTFFLLIPAWVLVYTGLRISMPKFVSPFMEVTAWMTGIWLVLVQTNKWCIERDKNIVELGTRFKVHLWKEECFGFRKAKLEVQAGKFDRQLIAVSIKNAVFLDNGVKTDSLELNCLLDSDSTISFDVQIIKPENNGRDIRVTLLWLNAETGNGIRQQSHYILVDSLFKSWKLSDAWGRVFINSNLLNPRSSTYQDLGEKERMGSGGNL